MFEVTPDVGDIIDPTAPDPAPSPVKAGSDDDVAPASDAVAHDDPEPTIPEPSNRFGRTAYMAGAELMGTDAGWDNESYEVRLQWASLAGIVIQDYDAYLVGQANTYAEQVAGAPTFMDRLQEAMGAELGDDQGGPQK